MSPLCKLWQALEEVPGARAAMAEWRHRLGADLESIRSMLIPTDRYAETLCVADDPYASYRVVRHNDNDIVGIHDRDGPAIALSKQDILVYRLDHQKMLRDIAAVLGIKYALANVDGVPYTYRIGSYYPFAGPAFPVFFTIPLESRDLYAATESITARCAEPLILLAPTSDRMRPECESLLKAHKACFLALDDAIDLDGRGRWVASAAARQRLTDVAQGVDPAEADVPASQPATPVRTWPDPKQHTTAKAWTVKSKSFCLSTTTERKDDGKVDFSMVDGKPTKQMQLMRLLCFMHPKAVAVAKVIEQVYPEELANARRDAAALKGLLKKIRSLISDIRNKKLGPAGINPEILPPLDIEITDATEITLNVAHLHKLDDIGFEDLAWEIGD